MTNYLGSALSLSNVRSVRLHRKVKTRQPHIVPSKGLSLPAKRRHSNSQQQFDQVSPLVGQYNILYTLIISSVCVCVDLSKSLRRYHSMYLIRLTHAHLIKQTSFP